MFWRKKKEKQESISQGSTSPSEKTNPHFDHKKPRAIICCISCKEALWQMEVRAVNGTVVSTKTLPVGRNKRHFDGKRQDCPLCGHDFGKTNPDGTPNFYIRSIKTGQSFSV
jgi:hypothetical protein